MTESPSQVREHCLAQLTKALHENCRVGGTTAVDGGDLESVAVYLEYTVFTSVKSVQVYKLTIHKTVGLCMCCVRCVM